MLFNPISFSLRFELNKRLSSRSNTIESKYKFRWRFVNLNMWAWIKIFASIMNSDQVKLYEIFFESNFHFRENRCFYRLLALFNITLYTKYSFSSKYSNIGRNFLQIYCVFCAKRKFWNFVSVVTRSYYYDYIGKIWNKSEDVYV